jgi:hypothetical protein
LLKVVVNCLRGLLTKELVGTPLVVEHKVIADGLPGYRDRGILAEIDFLVFKGTS